MSQSAHAVMAVWVSPQGLMLKRLDAGSAYQASKRSESWIKIKRCVLA
jgi:ATP-dependent DNA ligase